MSWPQIIFILKKFKDFFACQIVLDANHHYPENFQRTFRLRNCLSRKSSLSWKCSKTFSPAKLSYSQFIITLRNFKDFFACKIVLDVNHHSPENIQKLFRLQNCLRRKSSLSWKYSNTFSSAKIVLAANHLYPEEIQRLFRLPNCLSRKSSLSWKNSKTFSPAKLSYSQFIITLRNFKDFFACKIVLDANHHYLGNIQRLFRLQNCFRCKSSFPWKYSNFFSPAKLS